MIEAEQHLWQAAGFGRPGPFQIEAAIQSAHNRRAFDGLIPWPDILMLYQKLIQLRDTLRARVAYAGALGLAQQPDSGLEQLDQLSDEDVRTYQPYWAVRWHLLLALGRIQDSKHCRLRAIELSNDRAVRLFLEAGEMNF